MGSLNHIRAKQAHQALVEAGWARRKIEREKLERGLAVQGLGMMARREVVKEGELLGYWKKLRDVSGDARRVLLLVEESEQAA